MKLSAIFKERLNESDWQDEHARLTVQDMKDWCQKMRLQNVRVSKEGSDFVLNCTGNVRIIADDLDLDDDNMAFLPYKFGEVEGDFSIAPGKFTKMRNLKNCPYMVYGNFKASGLWLESLDGMPSSVGNECDISMNRLKDWNGIPSQCGHLKIQGNKIKTFTGISKNWTMGSELTCDAIERGVLELLDVEGLDTVKFIHNYGGTSVAAEVAKAQRIINSHLQGERDIFDLQSDFIEAGMPEWVKK